MSVDKKVQQYEEFVNEKLRKDLLVIEQRKELLFAEISDYLQLKTTCETFKTIEDKKLKTQVDLGCSFYVKVSQILLAIFYSIPVNC